MIQMTNIERNPFDGWIADEGQQGMVTLNQSGKLLNESCINTEETFSQDEITSFISEDSDQYTDLRRVSCPTSK